MNNEAADGKRRFVGVVVVDAFGSHVAGENTAVGRETGNGDTDVVVDLEDLLLVGGELGIGLVDAGQHDVGLGSEPNRRRALLDGFHGVLHLEQPPGGAPCRHVRVVLVPEHLRYVVVLKRTPLRFLFGKVSGEERGGEEIVGGILRAFLFVQASSGQRQERGVLDFSSLLEKF